MAEKINEKDKMDFTIDTLIAMVVEELSEDLGKDSKEILADYCRSPCRLRKYRLRCPLHLSLSHK